MAGEVNPRQFISLDYANADMYSALSQRPAPSTPLQKSTSVTEVNRENASTRAMEQNLWQEESARNAGYFLEQKQQSDAREEEITRREQAQRNEIKNKINNSPTSPEVGQPTPEAPLSKAPPPSTPEYQPAPSTGRPPPTPNGTAARASPIVEPTATPPPAGLAEPVRPGGGGFGALARSLPQAAGRLVIPGVFAAGDFAVRVVQGQPVGQAASGAVASTADVFAGAVVGTAIAGSVGEVIGGFIGGYIGGAIADSFFHNPPSTGSPPSEIPNYPPFLGGQASTGYNWNFYSARMLRQYGGFRYPFYCTGPITDFKIHGILNRDDRFSPVAVNWGCEFTAGGQVIAGTVVCDEDTDLPILILHRVDAKPDPDIIAPAPPPDNKPYYLSGIFPLNDDNTIPSGKPTAGLNKGKNRDVVAGISANNTPNSTGPYFPGHGGLAPSHLPNPTQTPSNLGGMLPSVAPAPAPPPFAEPKDVPPPRFAPAPGGAASPNPAGSASSDPGISALPDPNVSRIENGVVTSPPILTAQPIPLNSSSNGTKKS